MTSEPADSLRAEMEFLLQCLRDTSSGEPDDDALIALTPDVPWDAFVEEAARHGVAPLVYKRLESVQDAVRIPSAALEQLRDIYIHNALRNAAHLEEVKRILIAFRDSDVPVMVLKGVDLAVSVYAEMALRPMQDVDLLVHDSDEEKAATIMHGLGYRETIDPDLGIDYDTFHHLAPFHKKGALPVEVHRNLSDPSDPFRIDIDAIWDRARSFEVDGIETSGMSPEDMLIYLCIHAAYNHQFDVPLLPLHDIAVTTGQSESPLDWDALSKTANHDGRSRFVYSVLEVVQNLLAGCVPRAAVEQLEHDEADSEIVGSLKDSITAPPVDIPVAYRSLRRETGLSSRIRVLLRGVFPPKRQLEKTYRLRRGTRAAYWYYLVRPLDLLRRRGVTMLKLLTRAPGSRPIVESDERRDRIIRWLRKRRSVSSVDLSRVAPFDGPT